MDPATAVWDYSAAYNDSFPPDGLNVSRYNRGIDEYSLTASNTAVLPDTPSDFSPAAQGEYMFTADIVYMKQTLLREQWLAAYPSCITRETAPLPWEDTTTTTTAAPAVTTSTTAAPAAGRHPGKQ